MPRLTDHGLQKINDLAQRYGVSTDAVMTLLQALLNSKGTMAQFDHRELGGTGQWMPGGMTMVGDMFNHGLKAKVDGLCSELSQLLATQPLAPFPAGYQSQSQTQGGRQQAGIHDVLDTGSVSLFVPEAPGRASGQWWPAELGFPNGTGGYVPALGGEQGPGVGGVLAGGRVIVQPQIVPAHARHDRTIFRESQV